MNRLLLDANALLNAVFVPLSWSRMVVDEAARRKTPVLIGSETFLEAIKVAKRIARECGKRCDPSDRILGYVKISRFQQIRSDNVAHTPPSIPEHDRHVYREAISAEATILTSDAQLRLAFSSSEAMLPIEVLRRWAPETIGLFIFGVQPTADAGSVFFRGTPNWSSTDARGKFYCADFGAVRLLYDADCSSWSGEIVGATTIRLRADVQPIEQIVALSWDGSELNLRAASVEHPVKQSIGQTKFGRFAAETSMGCKQGPEHYWSGTVYALVMNDRPIGQRLWTKLRQHRELTPNPFDSDRLQQCIARALPF